jgi:uroporphyrinogen-III synthase
VAVIGPATGKALQAYGVTPAVMPDKHIAEALFAALQEHTDLSGARVLLPQGDLARPVMADLLRAAGARVETVVAYENVRPEIDPTLLAVPFDAVTFTSSSTVQNFVESFDDPLAVIGTGRIACIGPVTADTACKLGLPVHIVAEPHTVDGLIDALIAAFERKPTL